MKNTQFFLSIDFLLPFMGGGRGSLCVCLCEHSECVCVHGTQVLIQVPLQNFNWKQKKSVGSKVDLEQKEGSEQNRASLVKN